MPVLFPPRYLKIAGVIRIIEEEQLMKTFNAPQNRILLAMMALLLLLPTLREGNAISAIPNKEKRNSQDNQATKLFETAQQQYYTNQCPEALLNLETILNQQPSDIRAIDLQAKCYTLSKQYDKAIASYRDILQFQSWNLPVLEEILNLETVASNLTGIEATVEEMVKLDPVDGTYQLHLALSQLQQKNHHAARQSIANALAFSKPSDFKLLSKHDLSPLAKEGWNETAISDFKNLILSQQQEWHPVYALRIRIGALYKNKQFYDAIPLALQYVGLQKKLFGNDNAIVAIGYENLGDLYQKIGMQSEAEHYYREALWLRERCLPPSHPSLVMNMEKLAVMLRETGKYSEAEGLYREALEINLIYRNPATPHVPHTDFGHRALLGSLAHQFEKETEIGVVPTQLRLARVLMDMQRYDEAETVANEALLLDKATYSFWGNDASNELNQILAVQGRMDELLGRLNEEHHHDAHSVAKALLKLAAETEYLGNDEAALLIELANRLIEKNNGTGKG